MASGWDALTSGLCLYLKTYLFEYVVSENHISARHYSGKTLFVVIPNPDEVRGWPAARGMTMTPVEFKGFLYYLWKHWGMSDSQRSAGPNNLKEGTLTDAGWHSYNPPGSRQTALDYAVCGYGESHVMGALKATAANFQNDPIKRVYHQFVLDDIQWLEETYLAPSKRLERAQLQSLAKNECRRTLESDDSCRKLLASPELVNRFFFISIVATEAL